MKKEATKKSKLWIWLVAGLAVLLVAAGVLAFFMLGDSAANGDGSDGTTTPDATEGQGPRAELYWNLDRKLYTEGSMSGLSTREPGEDGIYRIRYAYNGQVVELPIADKQLVNFIDTMDCMGIVLDDNGTVIDAVDPKTLATETARMFYVRRVESGKIVLNSSMAMNGMNMDVVLTELSEIYDVSVDAENPGAKVEATALQPMDAVTVYSNAEGIPTHIYVVTHPVESPVYWRAENNLYNSTEKCTKRVPDADGYYTLGFYCDGEYVELKCNKVGIVNTIDAKNRYKAHTGLVVEDGIIVDNMLAATGIRGLLGCEMYDVTSVDGNTFEAEAMLAGSGDIYKGTLGPDTKIYDVSLATDPALRGKEAEGGLKIGDRIAVFENAEGVAQVIYVAHRTVDAPMYFNVTKKYDSTNKVTKRVPDSNGWYTIEMMSEGVIKTYKTQDKDIMTFIDSQNNRSVGLVLDGNVILRAYEGECIAGYGAFVGYTVKSVTGSIISMHPSTNPDNVTNRILNMNAKVYNMSGVKQEKGEITTLQVGDYCIMWRNPRSEIVYAYVIRRLVNAPVYFSLTRKWDSTTESTTRVPDADGYYVYECIKLGQKEKVTVKTKSKAAADFLDSQSPQTFALQINADGVIYEYYETAAVYGGNKSYLNHDVKRLDTLVTYYNVTEKTYTPKLAEDVKIYNLSSVYERYRGEPTTLQLNDRIQCYTNAKGEIAMIMVRIRKASGDIYFSKNRIKPVDGKLVREPDADGWYIFECAKDGKEVTVKTKDAEVALFLDSQSPRGFALQVDSDGVIKKAYEASAVLGGSTAALNQDITAIDGKVISTFYSVDGKARTFTLASKCKVYNVSSNYEDHWGETTTLKVGDQLQCYTNASGEIVIAYVTVRPAESYMGWNVDPNKGTTRVPDADGLYDVQLAVNGQINTYKASEAAIGYIDSANGAVAIFIKNGVIIEAKSAIYGPGVWTNVEAAVIATVQEVNGNTLKIKDSKGADREIVKASNFVCYDVSGNGEFKGVAATPAVGQYGRMYLNTNKEVVYFYIMPSSGSTPSTPSTPEEPEMPEIKEYDNSNLVFEEGTTRAYCAYCEETVEWTALEKITSATTLTEGAHYYLAEDILDNESYYNSIKNCVHLNGHNVTSSGRVFAVANGTTNLLTIMGNGTVTGASTATGTANVAGATISVRGNLNLIGGTYKHAETSTLPTIIMAKPQQTMNIYKDVKIEGTEGTTGTNLYIMFGIVNMYGGEITGGTATPNGTTKGRGDNVYIYGISGTTPARAEFNMYGGKVDGGIYAEKNSLTFQLIVAGDAVITANKGGLTLDAATDARLTLGALSDSAKVYISGQGNLTVENAKAQQYLDAGIIASADPAVELEVQNNVIVAPIVEEIPEPENYVWVMAWVVDPQFDATNNVTTRTPDADGYYYVELSIDGVTKTYKTKVRGLDGTGNGIDYADQSGSKNRAIAVCLKNAESLEFVEAKAATNNTGAKGAKVTTITAIEGGVITGTGVDYTGKVAADGKVFDVSNHATVEGEITELKVGDYCRFYTDANGDILYGYVYTRVGAVEPEPEEPTGLQLYWNVNRMDGGEESTRTPEADGYYYIDLAVNGEIKTFKTQNKNIIDYIDAKNAGATALTVDGDVITACNSALEGEGVASAGKSGTVNTVEGVKVIYTNIDAGEMNVNMAANVKIFDVSGNSEFIGQASELKTGDYFRCYLNADGEMLYIYILTRQTAAEESEQDKMNAVCEQADAMQPIFAEANGADVEAVCPACGKTVTWEAMPVLSNATISLTSGHYYFASDVTATAGNYSISNKNEDIEICIHLNGKTIEHTGTANNRVFALDYGEKLTVMGSGNVIGGRAAASDTTATQRCGSALEIVGNDTVVNLCGGTWSKSKNDLDVIGCRAKGEGGLNIYDGTVINIGEFEGNALWACGGNINLYGGEINGNISAVNGCNQAGTYYGYDLELVLAGTVVNGSVELAPVADQAFSVTVSGDAVIDELIVPADLTVQIGRMYAGADVKVTATGAFTNQNLNLQDYVDAGFLSAKAEGKTVTVTDGVASIVDATAEAGYDNSDLVFEEGTTRAYCTYCGEVKEWTALESTADNKTDGLNAENGGHYYLAEDLLENQGRYNVTGAVCVHLNGHNVTNTANRVFTLAKGSGFVLTIMGNGVVTGNFASSTTANVAAATVSVRSDLNLIGGTYKSGEATTLPVILMSVAERKLNVYEGATIEGNGDQVGLAVAYGHATVYGGTINAVEVLGQDVGGTAAGCSATILGGNVGKVYLDIRDPEGAYKTYQLDLIVGGAVKTEVTLAEGAQITISEDGLKKGAELTVTAADGAITKEHSKAAFYLSLGYFKAADEAKTITEKDGVLSIG